MFFIPVLNLMSDSVTFLLFGNLKKEETIIFFFGLDLESSKLKIKIIFSFYLCIYFKHDIFNNLGLFLFVFPELIIQPC